MKYLYFVRHGLSELNLAGKNAGITDTPLADEGRKQAKEAGKLAKKLGIEYIIASPLSRTLETATIIAKEIGYSEDKIEVNPMFIERTLGEREGQTWIPNTNYEVVKHAEKLSTLLARADRALHYIESLPYTKIMVVSHGAMGRALRHHIVEEQPFHHPQKFVNAEIVEWTLDR